MARMANNTQSARGPLSCGRILKPSPVTTTPPAGWSVEDLVRLGRRPHAGPGNNRTCGTYN